MSITRTHRPVVPTGGDCQGDFGRCRAERSHPPPPGTPQLRNEARQLASQASQSRPPRTKRLTISARMLTVSRLAWWWIDVHPARHLSSRRRQLRHRWRRFWRYTARLSQGRPAWVRSPSTPSGTAVKSSSPTAAGPLTTTSRLSGVSTLATCWSSSMRSVVCRSRFLMRSILTTNIEARLVAVGNPDDLASHFTTTRTRCSWPSRRSRPPLVDRGPAMRDP
jgi:hypothetical protein